MLKNSPYRVRRDILDKLHISNRSRRGGRKQVYNYFGHTEFTASIITDYGKAMAYIDNFPEVFPKFAGARPSMEPMTYDIQDEDGELQRRGYKVLIVIPIRCRLSAFIHDIDYALPVLMNAVSLITFFLNQGSAWIQIK
jgi:hypothetical protein